MDLRNTEEQNMAQNVLLLSCNCLVLYYFIRISQTFTLFLINTSKKMEEQKSLASNMELFHHFRKNELGYRLIWTILLFQYFNHLNISFIAFMFPIQILRMLYQVPFTDLKQYGHAFIRIITSHSLHTFEE